eukprot:Sspe_Gene.86294::Locus_56979_Transcript_1_1_Confidence_1.000_Length_684::g.86294::m.86294
MFRLPTDDSHPPAAEGVLETAVREEGRIRRDDITQTPNAAPSLPLTLPPSLPPSLPPPAVPVAVSVAPSNLVMVTPLPVATVATVAAMPPFTSNPTCTFLR